MISNALARIIRQLCLKVNLYGVLVFNIAGLQNVLNTFQQECCRPGHFWGEDQSWRSPNKCHYVKVSFFASWCFLSQPSIAAVFYLPSHHPRASLATSAQGNCLQRSPPNGEKASTLHSTLGLVLRSADGFPCPTPDLQLLSINLYYSRFQLDNQVG